MDFPSLFHAIGHIIIFTSVSVIGILVIRSLLLTIYNLFFHPLRHFPGPISWAGSIIPFAYTQLRGTDVYRILELHKRYGGVVRIGPDTLSYADAVVYRDVMAHKHAGELEFGKASTFTVTPANGVLSFLWASREDHAKGRRAFAASFSEKSMQRQQPRVLGYVDDLIKGLKEKRSDNVMDMTAWFNWTSFDGMLKINPRPARTRHTDDWH
jgi:cytochrome P450